MRIVKFQRNLRYSYDPAKQLMFIYLAIFLSDIKHKDTRVSMDYASGDFANYRLLKNTNYNSNDLFIHSNQSFISGNFINARISDVRVMNDISICTECFGINGYFNVDEYSESVSTMLSNLNPDGYLFYNVGNFEGLVDTKLDWTLTMLKNHHKLMLKEYGRFSNTRFPLVISILLAMIMYLFKGLAKSNIKEKRKYIIAVKRDF